jgi:biopolymer transport protein ExbB
MGLVTAGGPVVAFLLFLSLFVSVLAFVKIIQLFRYRLVFKGADKAPESFLDHWAKGDIERAREVLAGARSPQELLLRHAVRVMSDGQISGQALQKEMQRYGAKLMSSLRSYLRPIEVVATVAPLIGLLGTVIGMIEAFQAMESAGKQVDPSVLSGGIWQALLTTAVGLVVAIPASLIHSWFDRKAEVSGHLMADALMRLFTLEAKREARGLLSADDASL